MGFVGPELLVFCAAAWFSPSSAPNSVFSGRSRPDAPATDGAAPTVHPVPAVPSGSTTAAKRCHAAAVSGSAAAAAATEGTAASAAAAASESTAPATAPEPAADPKPAEPGTPVC